MRRRLLMRLRTTSGLRATAITAIVKGLNRHGEEQTIEGRDLLARAFQHEIDHLDGVVFIDRLRGIKREMIVRKIQKLKKSGKWYSELAKQFPKGNHKAV